jgi:succinoglycan biosynthesis protein ExoV
VRLYYFKCKQGNFGDDLNAWLWERLIPAAFNDKDDALFCGIGMILNNDIPIQPKRKIVFGSGAGYGKPPEGFGDNNWQIISVRGPLTAKLLNLSEGAAVTDGAILLSVFPEFEPIPKSKREGVVFMPHCGNSLEYGAWQNICQKAGIKFLDPRDDTKQTTQSIRHSRLVIAEAMHAAIVADTMRVPWVPVTISCHVNHFKWLDWTLSLDLPYRPISLSPSNFLEAWQNIRLKMAGEEHSLPILTANEALAHMKKQLDMLSSKEWSAGKIKSETINRRLSKLMRYRGFSQLTYLADVLFRQYATMNIKTMVAKQTTFLSNELIFRQKIDEMKNRLETLRVSLGQKSNSLL